MLASNGIAISMGGRGVWRDNVFVERLWRSVKYGEVYPRGLRRVSEARASIGHYPTHRAASPLGSITSADDPPIDSEILSDNRNQLLDLAGRKTNMSFIKNDWYVAAWAEEVTAQPLARTIGNEPVVIYRDASGRVGALFDRCSHRGAPLSLGEVVPQGLQCNYHGLVFDTSGQCVRIPGQERIPSRAGVKSFPVEEKDEFIWIWLGDPARADSSKIVDYPYHNNHKEWPHKRGILRIAGHYMLVIDNLMDLTHVGYTHKNTIGSGSSQEHVEAQMKTERTSRGVKFTRWLLNCTPPLTYSKAVPHLKDKVDRWMEFEFISPGNVLQFTGATDANTGAYDQGRRDGGVAIRIFHAVTPETDNSCHYFFAPMNGFNQDDPKTTEHLFGEIVRTFNEDKLFIEAQQARIESHPQPPLLDIVSDTARVQGRRHVNQRLAEEAGLNEPVEAAQNGSN